MLEHSCGAVCCRVLGQTELVLVFLLLARIYLIFVRIVHAAPWQVIVKVFTDVTTRLRVRVERHAGEWSDSLLRVADVPFNLFLDTIDSREHGCSLRARLFKFLYVEWRIFDQGVL